MKKQRKNAWTIETACAYVAKVMNKKAPRGLKYCSAVDYLNKIQARAIVSRA